MPNRMRLPPQVIAALQPPAWQIAKNAVAMHRRLGIRYQDTRAAYRAQMNLLPPWVRPEDGLVVDLGANHGVWTDAIVTAMPSVRVLAVEPFPPAYEALKERFRTRSSVIVDGRAVSDKVGEAQFHVSDSDVFGSLLEFDPAMEGFYGQSARESATILVPAVTLDELVTGRVSYMKIDVQGAELQVFEGGEQTLVRTDAILIEANLADHYKGGSNFATIYQALTERGFVLWDMAPPYRSQGRALWTDVMYARPR